MVNNDERMADWRRRNTQWRTDKAAKRMAEMHQAQRRANSCILAGEMLTGCTYAELFVVHRDQRGDWSVKRAEFWRVMRDSGMSYPDIARATGFAHSAIVKALETTRP
jgi:adenosyl cobinamide kinase/adenosyl cobinamide phosphate guanylyltransferase